MARLLQKKTEEANLYVPLGTCVVSPNTADEEELNNDKTRETYVDTKEHELDPETNSVKDDSNKTNRCLEVVHFLMVSITFKFFCIQTMKCCRINHFWVNKIQ